MLLLSPAKLNLGLWILDKRPDGYHDIFTVFHTVDLCDEITIEEGPKRVETNNSIPQEQNLVYRALNLLEKRLAREVHFSVYINKKIPIGGGLGGGSSNVATVLRAVNNLLGNPLPFEDLLDIAGSVSSDAPFFFYGGTAVATNRGDTIKPIKHINLNFTIVCPSFAVSSKKVYSMVTKEQLTKHIDIDKIINCIHRREFEVLENTLGDISAKAFPQVGEVVRFLSYMGYKPLVTGSGSCVYVIGEVSKDVHKAIQLRRWSLYKVKSWHGV